MKDSFTPITTDSFIPFTEERTAPGVTPQRSVLANIITAGFDVAKDIPAQIGDLLSIPSRIARMPSPPLASKLATEGLPYLAEKMFTPIGEIPIPETITELGKAAVRAGVFFDPEPIKRWTTVEPTPAMIAWYGLMGGMVASNTLALAKWNYQINKLIRTEEVRGAVMDNMPAFENLMAQVGMKTEGMDLQAKTNFILSQAGKDPKIGSVVMGLVDGTIKMKPAPPVAPIDITPTPTAPAVTPKVPAVAPKVPAVAPVAVAPPAMPGVVPELKPLYQEALKYKTAEEFVDKIKYISDRANIDKLTKKELALRKLIVAPTPHDTTPILEEMKRIDKDVKTFLTDIWHQVAIHPHPTPTPEVKAAEVKPALIARAHILAQEKGLISEKGKPKPQYRFLAENITGLKSTKDMTPEQIREFIDTLERLPKPTIRAGKIIPPPIARRTELVPADFFNREFKKPTPAKLLTSQTRYAELLGIKELVKPFEIGKLEMQQEYAKLAKAIDMVKKKIVDPEKMAVALNIHEQAPAELTGEERKVFDYYRGLTNEMLEAQNTVYRSLGQPEIKGVKAYFRHIADTMSEDVIHNHYPLPEGIKYWSEQTVGKKVYNPMEMHRKLKDDLLERFSKDLAYSMKSMVWTALKVKHLSIPKHILNKQLGVLSKDKLVYENLTPEEKKFYDAQMTMPAATKKWLLDYVNIALGDRQTALDESVNLWITDTPIKTVLNSILKPFGKHIGHKPATDMITSISRLPIYGVMGGVNPRQLLRNKFQTLQQLALYGVRNTIMGYLPTHSHPTLEKLKTDSLFLKSYSGFEDMPLEMRGKAERLALAPYQWSAISNVSQGMNSAYHWTADYIQNPAKKELGWADPQRTYNEPADYFYPSEKERLLKEMEYGAHTTHFQYIGMGMPEVFRYKSLAGLTRLQSWWMNHWFVFHREAATRAWTGHTGYDSDLKITLNDRINYLKYLIIAGIILNTLGYTRSYLFGTAPTSLPPTAQLALGLYMYYTNLGDTPWEKKKRAEAGREIKNSAMTFIPFYLSVKDTAALFKGDKHWTEYFFYKKAKPKPKARF